MFLLLDTPDKEMDKMLADHIGFVHKNLRHPDTENETFGNEFMRAYVTLAKGFNPVVSNEAAEYIQNKYVAKRKVIK